MISKRIKTRKDGKSSASDALSYGEGLKVDRETGELLDKSHRTRIGNFGLVDDGVYAGRDVAEMAEIINLAAIEMQANCDQNTKVGADKKLAHFVVSFNQDKPSEAVLRDTEDSMLAAMDMDKNHFATFLHNDNGYWHLHIFASRIEKEKPHRGNSLWHDQINRDKVCREVEARHGLQPDNGMHRVNELGQIIEIPRAERQAKREAKPAGISDRAKTTEIYSGEKSFQAWVNEIRIGDRLKHAKSWKDLHAAAAAYGCEVKEKGAGFVICPTGQKGGLSLSKIGLTKLPSKFGAFQKATPGHQVQPEKIYEPGPTQEKGNSHYSKWKKAKDGFKSVRTDKINKQREAHALARQSIRAKQKTELAAIRAATPGQDRFAAISISKMQHTVEQTALKEQFAEDRQALRRELASAGPGNTFRDFLVIEAKKGDDVALGLARTYGVDESTEVLKIREADQLKIVAAVQGKEYRPAPRMNFRHQVQRNGTVVYDFGQGRKVTDSAISRQVQLNDAAAHSPEAIAMALTFATTKFGNTLTLTGSPEFQRLAVETAVLKHLGIKFADPALEAYRAKFAAEQKPIRRAELVPDLSHLTPNQIAKGVTYVLTNTLDQGRPPAHIITRNARDADARARLADDLTRLEERAAALETNPASSVHELPAGRLDAPGKHGGMLLPDALHDGLGNTQTGQDQDVRRAGTSERGSRIELDASSRLPVTPSNEPGTGAELSRKAPAAEPATQVLTLTPEQAAADAAKGVQEAMARVKEAATLAALAEAHRLEQEKAEAAKVAQAEAAEAQKVADAEKAAEEHRLSEPVQLADIQHQIAETKAEADPNSLIHSKPVVLASEEDHAKETYGEIMGGNETFVGVVIGREIKIYRVQELTKQTVKYDGIASGHDRFAKGNNIEIKTTETVVSEEREDMQTEEKKQRERDKGLGR